MTPHRAQLAAGVAIGLVLVGTCSALASFTNAATASQTISTRTLPPPTALTGAASGHDVDLSWTAGAGGSATSLSALANGASASCPGTGYSAVTSTSATTATDTGRYTPQGTWECYQAVTTYNTWSSISANPTVAVQLGVVADSVAIANGGVAGKIGPGDSVTITFNQPIAPATGPAAADTACSATSGTVVLGSTGSGASCATTQAALGTLTGLTVSTAGRWNATWTWSAGNTVLTVTLGTQSAGSTPTVSGAGSLHPTTTAGAMLSATGNFQVCSSNAGGGNCLPTATGGF